MQVPQASPAALDLIASLCHWDPAKRPTAAQALQHPFFQVRLPLPCINYYITRTVLNNTRVHPVYLVPFQVDPKSGELSLMRTSNTLALAAVILLRAGT